MGGVQNLSIKPFKKAYKEGVLNILQDAFQSVENKLQESITNADVYNMNNEVNRYQAGGKSQSRFITFFGASPVAFRATISENPVFSVAGVFNDVSFDGTLHPKDRLVKSPEGVVVGLFNTEHYELYIPQNLDSISNEYVGDFFKGILSYVFEEILNKIEMEMSWIYSPIKDELTKQLTTRVSAQMKRQRQEDQERHDRLEHEVVDLQRRLKASYDNMALLKKSLAIAIEGEESAKEKIVKELDTIVAHDRVKDLRIEGDKVRVYVDGIHATDKKNRTFYIGNFEILINMSNSDVRFYGDNPRRSHWSGKDPHPHVSGNSGQACLGNVAQTIAELCSYNELYALFLTCLDFLENANIDDSAGKNVVNWAQLVDGKLIDPRVEEPLPETAEDLEEADDDDYDEDHDEDEDEDGDY